MEIKHECSYLCVVCEKNKIVASCTEETYEGLVPDQSNCDLSTYKNHKAAGGRLLGAPKNAHEYRCYQPSASGRPQFGGICDECLKRPGIKLLVTDLRLSP